MPVALERALKRRASKLGLGEKRKAAYVYGTLRKTGWKPSHQKMEELNPRLVRLAAIGDRLNSIIQLQYEDEDYDTRKRFPWLKTGAAVGAGAGGVLGHQAIQRTGGYGANVRALRYGPDLLGKATGNIAESTGAVGAGARRVALPALTAGKKALKPLLGRFGLDSKEQPIRLDETILEPFQANSFEGKLYQRQFPAGPSPLSAMRLSLPKLMALLEKKQHLRQVFSRKHEKLVELNAKLDEIQFISKDALLKAGAAGAGAAGAAGAGYAAYRGISEHRRKVRKFQRSASDDDFVPISNDLYIDRHGAMYPGKHPRVKGGNITSLQSREGELQFREDRSRKTVAQGAAIAGVAGAGGVGYLYRREIGQQVGGRYRAGLEAATKASGRFERKQQGRRLLKYLSPSLSSAAGIKPQSALSGLRRQVTSGLKGARYARLSANIDNLIEFKLPPEFLAKAKKKAAEADEKEKPKKKGRVSHGGGT